MRTRLKDVAELAGVSVKTVSNVVNGYIHVRPETRARVQQAINELNYRPNLSARSLRRGRSGVIALAVPELNVPYFAELARHVVGVAGAAGLTVLIDQTEGDVERERLVVSGIRDQMIDGLIFNPLALTERDLAERDEATPLVLIGERIHGAVADHVLFDNVAAARKATEHLIDLGRRRIAVIGAQTVDAGQTSIVRAKGYREALEAAGLPVEPHYLRPTDRFHRADGYQAMRDLLAFEDRPDAVFCFNDLLALGALRALYEAGVRVPEEVAVIGFDGIDEGRFSAPSLSTISPDKAEIARLAVERLQLHLNARVTASPSGDQSGPSGEPGSSDSTDGEDNEEAGSPTEVLVGYTLITRESTVGRQ